MSADGGNAQVIFQLVRGMRDVQHSLVDLKEMMSVLIEKYQEKSKREYFVKLYAASHSKMIVDSDCSSRANAVMSEVRILRSETLFTTIGDTSGS